MDTGRNKEIGERPGKAGNTHRSNFDVDAATAEVVSVSGLPTHFPNILLMSVGYTPIFAILVDTMLMSRLAPLAVGWYMWVGSVARSRV